MKSPKKMWFEDWCRKGCNNCINTFFWAFFCILLLFVYSLTYTYLHSHPSIFPPPPVFISWNTKRRPYIDNLVGLSRTSIANDLFSKDCLAWSLEKMSIFSLYIFSPETPCVDTWFTSGSGFRKTALFGSVRALFKTDSQPTTETKNKNGSHTYTIVETGKTLKAAVKTAAKACLCIRALIALFYTGPC